MYLKWPSPTPFPQKPSNRPTVGGAGYAKPSSLCVRHFVFLNRTQNFIGLCHRQPNNKVKFSEWTTSYWYVHRKRYTNVWKYHMHALYTRLVYSQIGAVCEFTISHVSHVLTCRYRRFSFERSYQNFGLQSFCASQCSDKTISKWSVSLKPVWPLRVTLPSV